MLKNNELRSKLEELESGLTQLLSDNKIDFDTFIYIMTYQSEIGNRAQDMIDVMHGKPNGPIEDDVGKKPYHRLLKATKRVKNDPSKFPDIINYGTYKYKVASKIFTEPEILKLALQSKIGDCIVAIDGMYSTDDSISEISESIKPGTLSIGAYTNKDKYIRESKDRFGVYWKEFSSLIQMILVNKLCTYATLTDMEKIHREIVAELNVKDMSEPQMYIGISDLVVDIGIERILYVVDEDFQDKRKWPYRTDDTILSFLYNAFSKRSFLTTSKVQKIRMLGAKDDGEFSNHVLFEFELLKRLIELALKRRESWMFKNRVRYSVVSQKMRNKIASKFCYIFENTFTNVVSDKIILRALLADEFNRYKTAKDKWSLINDSNDRVDVECTIDIYENGPRLKEQMKKYLEGREFEESGLDRNCPVSRLCYAEHILDEIFIDE